MSTSAPEEAGNAALAPVARRLAAASQSANASKRATSTADPPRILDINLPRVYVRWPEPSVDRLPYQRALAAALAARPEVLEAHAVADTGVFSETYRPLFERSNHPGRDADVRFLPRPHDVLETFGDHGRSGGASRGAPYLYDQTVPIVLAGPGVPRGQDDRPYDMTRLAPTIAALIGIDPPAAARALPLPIVENQ